MARRRGSDRIHRQGDDGRGFCSRHGRRVGRRRGAGDRLEHVDQVAALQVEREPIAGIAGQARGSLTLGVATRRRQHFDRHVLGAGGRAGKALERRVGVAGTEGGAFGDSVDGHFVGQRTAGTTNGVQGAPAGVAIAPPAPVARHLNPAAPGRAEAEAEVGRAAGVAVLQVEGGFSGVEQPHRIGAVAVPVAG